MRPRRPSPHGPFPDQASISLSSNPDNQFPHWPGSLSHQVRHLCRRTQGGRSGGCCRRLSLSRLVAGSFASRLIPEPFGRRSTPTIVPFPGWVDLDRSTACSGFLSLLLVSATAGGKYKDVVACFRPGTAIRRVAWQPEGGIRPSIEQDQSPHIYINTHHQHTQHHAESTARSETFSLKYTGKPGEEGRRCRVAYPSRQCTGASELSRRLGMITASLNTPVRITRTGQLVSTPGHACRARFSPRGQPQNLRWLGLDRRPVPHPSLSCASQTGRKEEGGVVSQSRPQREAAGTGRRSDPTPPIFSCLQGLSQLRLSLNSDSLVTHLPQSTSVDDRLGLSPPEITGGEGVVASCCSCFSPSEPCRSPTEADCCIARQVLVSALTKTRPPLLSLHSSNRVPESFVRPRERLSPSSPPDLLLNLRAFQPHMPHRVDTLPALL
jgi:hypothetical protein